MIVIAKGAHGTAVVWPGFSTDPWPQDLIDFFGVGQQNIVPAIIRATWVGDAETGHYVTEVKTPNGWAPLPDGAYLVKYNQGGALYAFDAATFGVQFRVA